MQRNEFKMTQTSWASGGRFSCASVSNHKGIKKKNLEPKTERALFLSPAVSRAVSVSRVIHSCPHTQQPCVKVNHA